jgi:hypothetical protein
MLTRGSCVSPSVHRQSALLRDGGRFTRASVERRGTFTSRTPNRSGDGATARLRVRRLRRSRDSGRGDPAIQPAAVQRTTARRERGPASRRSTGGSAPRRLQRTTAGWTAVARRLQLASSGGLCAAAGRRRRNRRPHDPGPEFWPGRTAEEQAEVDAQGLRSRSTRPDQGATGRPLVRRRRRLARSGRPRPRQLRDERGQRRRRASS